jgi:hypothetical protein
MKTFSFFWTSLFLSALTIILNFRNELNFKHQVPNTFVQYDSSSSKTKEFKTFSKIFFDAIKTSDSVFLKAHIIFPIINSSLCDLDGKLKENKHIDEKYFFKNLRRLFPLHFLRKIDQGGVFLVSKSNIHKKFIIKVYDNSGVETNFSWIFTEKNGKYYFVNFLAEAG